MSNSPAIPEEAARPRSIARRWAVRLLSVLITLALMAWLLSKIEWSEFGALLGRLSPLSLGLAALGYLAQNFFRALRFRVLLARPDLPLRRLLPITLYHNFLVRVLPFKLGEISYVVLARTHLGIALEQGISSLFGARVLELLVVVLMAALGFALVGVEQMGESGRSLLLLVGLSFVGAIAALYYSGALLRLLAAGLRRFFAGRAWAERPLLQRLLRGLQKLARELDALRAPRLFAAAFAISFATYGSAFFLNYILMSAIGVQGSLAVFLAVVGVGQFGIAFPFAVSGFGVVEFSWALGLSAFAGLSLSEAAAVGVLLHGFQISAAALYGGLSYLWLRRA